MCLLAVIFYPFFLFFNTPVTKGKHNIKTIMINSISDIGLVTKTENDPLEIIKERKRFDSIILPRIRASIIGPMGKLAL